MMLRAMVEMRDGTKMVGDRKACPVKNSGR
jgi:hypothetical protein